MYWNWKGKCHLFNRTKVGNIKIKWDCIFKRNRNYKQPYSFWRETDWKDGKINDQDLSSCYYERDRQELSILEFATHSKTQYCHNNLTTTAWASGMGTGMKRKIRKAVEDLNNNINQLEYLTQQQWMHKAHREHSQDRSCPGS